MKRGKKLQISKSPSAGHLKLNKKEIAHFLQFLQEKS